MAEKSSRRGKRGPRAVPYAEIKEAIESALRRVGLPPTRENFDLLGAKVGVAGTTLYNAYLGHQGLGPGPLFNLRGIGVQIYNTGTMGDVGLRTNESPDTPRKMHEEIGFILTHGSTEQVALFEKFVEATYSHVAAKKKRKK